MAIDWINVNQLVNDYETGKNDGSEVIKALEPALVNIVKAGRSFTWGSFDDALQMARIYVWQALKSYDRKFGVPFKNYVFDIVKERLKKRPSNNDKVVSISDPTDWNEFSTDSKKCPTTDTHFEAMVTEAELLESVKAHLTEMEYKCLVGRLDGLSYAEIEKRYGFALDQIHNACKRIRKKFSERNLFHDA